MTRSFLTAALIAASLGLAGCKTTPKELPPAPGPTTTTTEPETAINTGPVPGSQEDFLASVTSDTILFDTDRFNIDAADMAILQSQAQWLARNPGKRVILEGHADERGTRDYNLALGEKRANSAKNYLASVGVDAGRITTISYGKERPVALGSDEESWAKNRRAVTVTVQ